jgi:hypothetical protein
MENLTKGKMKMTIDSHDSGSEKGHSKRKEDAREDGKKRMSDEEFNREMIELKVRLNYVEQLLQEYEENQRCGWIMKKKARWPIKQLIAREQRHRLKACLKKVEALKIVECEVEVHYCEPEQGSILGEDDDEMMMCSDQHKEGMIVTSSETEESHEIQTNCLCEYVFAGTEENEVEQKKGITKEA